MKKLNHHYFYSASTFSWENTAEQNLLCILSLPLGHTWKHHFLSIPKPVEKQHSKCLPQTAAPQIHPRVTPKTISVSTTISLCWPIYSWMLAKMKTASRGRSFQSLEGLSRDWDVSWGESWKLSKGKSNTDFPWFPPSKMITVKKSSQQYPFDDLHITIATKHRP